MRQIIRQGSELVYALNANLAKAESNPRGSERYKLLRRVETQLSECELRPRVEVDGRDGDDLSARFRVLVHELEMAGEG